MDKIIIPEGQRSRVYDIMRKLVLKTALITLGVVLVLAVAAFGVISLCAPAVMCDFTLSLGMESVSADYAYQEYQRSDDLAYLARSVELAAGRNDAKAEERFDLLYAAEGFDEMCAARDAQQTSSDIRLGSYHDYLCGVGACVKYRLADTQEGYEEALALALAETDTSFPVANPLYMLSVEAASADDAAFCAKLLAALKGGSFTNTDNNKSYEVIETILKEVASE